MAALDKKQKVGAAQEERQAQRTAQAKVGHPSPISRVGTVLLLW